MYIYKIFTKTYHMKKFLTLIVLGMATISFAYTQSFSTSGIKTGGSADNPDRGVASTYFITHSLSQSIMASNSISCNSGGLHTDNSYMRVFDLQGSFGISGPINVTSVDFAIESASAGSGGTQPATINIYTLSGPLLFSNLTLIATQPLSVPNQTFGYMNVPISANIPAGSIMVVEIFTPDGQAAGNKLFLGSNNLGQTGPTYIAAALCGISEPTDVALIGFPNMQLVLNVNADANGPASVPISTWAIIIGILLMSSLILFRVKR
jgi:hypothetical protein